MVFRLSLVLSMVKFSAGNQFFGLKTTSRAKPDLKNSFLRSDLRCGDILGEVQGEVGVQGHLYSNISQFFAGVHLFGMKTTSHGKPRLKNQFQRSDWRCGDILCEGQNFLGQVYHMKWFSFQKFEYLQRMNLLQTRLGL